MVRPSPRTLVVIQTDPTKSHRAVEALRIALGLGSHNEGQDISIILCGRAPHLLAEDTGDIVDAEILDKHLPDADTPHQYTPDIVTKPVTPAELAAAMESADRALIFS